jgi:hypothetical protein
VILWWVGCAQEEADWASVAPVLERCVGCHHEGGPAPFGVESSDLAAPWAEPMADAAASRRMPPFLADNTGTCGTFDTHEWLSDDEIARLGRWAAEGAPAGGEKLEIPVPERLEGALTLQVGQGYEPTTTPDEYRCFLVDPGLEEDRFLTAFQVVPTDPKLVHHVILYTLDSEVAEETADTLDALDEAPGYSCFGSSAVPDSRPIAAWAPGTPLTRLPADSGLRLLPGRLVVQVHYHGTGSGGTSVQLELQEGVAREAMVVLLADLGMSLPPGEREVHHSWELPLGQLGLPLGAYVRGVFPHMHRRGRTLRLEVVREGATDCALAVPRWDFGWQRMYFYEQPLYVDPDDTIRLQCTFDTEQDELPVEWGEGTEDEMCLVGLLVTFG